MSDVVAAFLEKHSSDENFELDDAALEHVGVKGMRWGIRRDRDKPGGADGKEEGHLKVSSADGKIDNPSDIKLSADAEKFVKTRLKEGHEMSDREIKEAIQRAENVEKYNKMFAPDANQQLANQVAQLKLQKEYAQLNAELNPSRMARVQKLIKSSGVTPFAAYQMLDKATGGAMSKEFKNQMKGAFAAAKTQPSAPSQPKPNSKTTVTVKPNPNTRKSKQQPPMANVKKNATNNSKTADPNTVFSVTNLGDKNDFPDPSILALPPGS